MAETRDEEDVFWVDPDMRGIIPIQHFHLPRSLKKTVKADLFDLRVDTTFPAVMRACAAPRASQSDTWINPHIERAYTELFHAGHAHSVECWQEGVLVGGLYGVHIGAAFFGESMFHTVTNASKVALVYLVARLKAGGFTLLDTQFITDHLSQFGTTEIPRQEYHARLDDALAEKGDFYHLPPSVNGATLVQLITQTS